MFRLLPAFSFIPMTTIELLFLKTSVPWYLAKGVCYGAIVS